MAKSRDSEEDRQNVITLARLVAMFPQRDTESRERVPPGKARCH